MDFIKKIFGFSNNQPTNSQEIESIITKPFTNQERSRILFDYDKENCPNEEFGDKFNVYTDPMEMHRYFEQQMDQVFEMFGFPRIDNFFNSVPTIPSIEGNNSDKDPDKPTNPRDYFLKNEPITPHYEDSAEKADKDVDGILNIEDLGSVLKGSTDLKTYKQKPLGKTFFSQSVQIKTIRKPDGSVETHKTVRDSQGNKETIITQNQGDKKYTVIKKMDKDGKEEIEEIMVNMDNNDKPFFKQSKHHDDAAPLGKLFDSTMFDRFFK